MREKHRKSFLLIPLGLFVLAASFIISHYTTVPDFVAGLLIGIGIGLMTLPLLLKRLKADSN